MSVESPKFQVSLPEEFKSLINKWSTGQTLDEKVKLSLAIGLFAGKMVTLARAAELAGKPLIDFIVILKQQGIPWMEYAEEEKRQDDLAIRRILEEKGNDDK